MYYAIQYFWVRGTRLRVMTLLKRLSISCCTVILVCAAAKAGIIKDPSMGMEDGSFSSPILPGGNFIPDPAGGGSFGFFNPNSSFIVEIDFFTFLFPNLNPADVNTAFTCNSGPANPFFLNCGFQYFPSSGLLTIRFFGVNPSDAPEDPFDNEAGEEEGIPTIPPGCPVEPAAGTPCFGVGHFVITLNDGFVVDPGGGGTGGWSDPNLFPGGDATLFVSDVITASPEPGTMAMAAGALAAIAAWRRRRRRPAA
jgi:MYXO-CTERM domain-containing protein